MEHALVGGTNLSLTPAQGKMLRMWFSDYNVVASSITAYKEIPAGLISTLTM